jgi:hypothetical protein
VIRWPSEQESLAEQARLAGDMSLEERARAIFELFDLSQLMLSRSQNPEALLRFYREEHLKTHRAWRKLVESRLGS